MQSENVSYTKKHRGGEMKKYIILTIMFVCVIVIILTVSLEKSLEVKSGSIAVLISENEAPLEISTERGTWEEHNYYWNQMKHTELGRKIKGMKAETGLIYYIIRTEKRIEELEKKIRGG